MGWGFVLIASGRLDPIYLWLLTGSYIAVLVSAAVLVRLGRYDETNLIEGSLVALGIAVAIIVLAVELGVDGNREARAENQRVRDLFASGEVIGNFDGFNLDTFILTDGTARGALFENTQIGGLTATRSDFTGATFAGARVVDGGFVSADYRASLEGSNLTGVPFTEARLERVNFRNTVLDGNDFTDVVCIECDFRGAAIFEVNLAAAADLSGSLFDTRSLATIPGNVRDLGAIELGGDASGLTVSWLPTEFPVDFNSTNLNSTDLSGVDFGAARLRTVSLIGATLDGADLAEATAQGVIFGSTNAADVSVRSPTCVGQCPSVLETGIEIVLDRIAPDDGREADGMVARAELVDGTLTLAPGQWRISGAINTVELDHDVASNSYTLFVDADIRTGVFDGANLSGSRFDGASLGTSSFNNVNLSNTSFLDADLSTTTGLLEAELVDPINGGLVFYDNDTQLPPGNVSTSWFNIDEPVAYELKLNWIVSGFDLSADGPSVTPFAGRGSNYSNFQAVEAGLRFLSFNGTNLLISDFIGSDLRSSTFHQTNLIAARFDGAFLDSVGTFQPADSCSSTSSQFCNAYYNSNTVWPSDYTPPADAINLDDDISDRNLSGAQLAGSGTLRNLAGTGVRFDRANLSGVDLTGSNLRAGSFMEVNAQGIRLNASELAGTEWRCARLEGATVRAADLRGADFTGAALSGASLRGADLTGALFTAADLTGVDLTGARVDEGALDQAIIDETTKLPAGFAAPTPAPFDDPGCPP
ncbi:MAG: pentapeptide repeat-containing protein [Actinomycetota bacterium]